MTPLLTTLLLTWSQPTENQHLDGLATYYVDGLFETVMQNRGVELPPGVIPVALNRAGDLGREVWLVFPSGRVYHGLSVDCAQEGEHYLERLRLGRIVEVPFYVAGAEGFAGVGPHPVAVWFTTPPEGWR